MLQGERGRYTKRGHSEFDSHWVSHTSGLVLYLSIVVNNDTLKRGL